jgi:hypothetical protein
MLTDCSPPFDEARGVARLIDHRQKYLLSVSETSADATGQMAKSFIDIYGVPITQN